MMRQTIPFECALIMLCLLIIDPLFCNCCNVIQFNNGSDTEQFEFRTNFDSTQRHFKSYKVVYIINSTYIETKIVAYVSLGRLIVTPSSTADVTLTGNVSRGDFSFILRNVSKTKAGLYELQEAGSTLNCTELFILGKPTTPILKSVSATEEGNSMTFTCYSSSSTYPADHGLSLSYGWFVDGQADPPGNRSSYTNNTLRISNIQRSDMDIPVTCIAKENVAGGFTSDTSNQLRMVVYYGPTNISFSPANDRYMITQGTFLPNITCEADCNPACNYIWYKGGRTYVVHVLSQTLSLGQVSDHDAATYLYRASRSGHTLERKLTVDVIYGPMDIFPTSGSVFIRDIASSLSPILCSSRCWECNYTWTGPVNETGSHLSIGKLQKAHDGIYTCTATNTRSSAYLTTRISIKVRYPPDTTITIERHTDQIDTITLKCSAQGNPHTYTWKWTHIAPDNLTEVQRYTGIPNGGENLLVLKNTTYMDSGIYKCTVSNNVKTPTVNYESIRITDKPYVIEGQREFDAAIQDNISMAVQVFSGPLDLLNITWLKGGNGTKHTIDRVGRKYNVFVTNEVVVVPYYTKHVSQPGYRCQLDIHHIQEEDFTEYNVLISNTEGTVAVKMFVIPKVPGAPDIPRQLEAVQNSVTTSSVVLTWISGFHGGADQIFYIQMKTDTSPWNNRLNVAGWLKKYATFNVTIDNLSPGMHYFFKAFAVNIYGRSEFSAVINVTTKTQEGNNQASSSVGASIGGAISGVMAAIIVGVAILFLLRRYKRMPACMVKQGSKEVQMDDTVPGHIEVDAHSTVTEGEKRSANIAKDDSSGSSQYENMSTSGELSMTYEQLAVRNPANSQRIADSTNVQGKEPKMKPEHVYSSLQGGSSDTDKRRSNHVYTNLRGFITTNVTTGSSKQSADADIVVYSNLRLQAD